MFYVVGKPFRVTAAFVISAFHFQLWWPSPDAGRFQGSTVCVQLWNLTSFECLISVLNLVLIFPPHMQILSMPTFVYCHTFIIQEMLDQWLSCGSHFAVCFFFTCRNWNCKTMHCQRCVYMPKHISSNSHRFAYALVNLITSLWEKMFLSC